MVNALGYIGLTLVAVGILGMVARILAMIGDVTFGWRGAFDFAARGFLGGMGALLIGALLAAPAIVVDTTKQRDAFMRDCLQDRKEYECTAMWRAGENHTTVMPMPIIVPTR